MIDETAGGLLYVGKYTAYVILNGRVDNTERSAVARGEKEIVVNSI